MQMKRIYLKIIVLAMVLCLGGVTAFGQETLTKPPKPDNDQTETTKINPPKKAGQTTPSVLSTPTGYIYGHDYMDLGLSVCWATCNMGASSPTEYGNYYAWGEISAKSAYMEDDDEEDESESSTYKTKENIAGDSRYDAARANWGDPWRMPTLAEVEELINNCTTEWITLNGVRGMLVTSMINGNSIFLPAAGSYFLSSLSGAGVIGGYWSSLLDEGDMRSAFYLYFRSDHFGWDRGNCNYERSVRAVTRERE